MRVYARMAWKAWKAWKTNNIKGLFSYQACQLAWNKVVLAWKGFFLRWLAGFLMSAGVSQAEFARIAGVNRSTVNRWIKNGRISVDENGQIDPERAQRERKTTESPLPHHQARKSQIDAQKTAQSSGMDLSSEDVGLKLRIETYKLQKAKAEAANIEIDRLAGALVERADIDYVMNDIGSTLRGLLEGWPDRLAPSLAAHRGQVAAIHAELEGEAAELLNAIADHIARKIDEVVA